jgi:hypothetical protein
MTQLVLYENACRALTEALHVDEVKMIENVAEQMQLYARQWKDRRLMERATDLRKRAEIRMGLILIEMKEKGQRDTGKGNRNPAFEVASCYSKARRPRHQQNRILSRAEARGAPRGSAGGEDRGGQAQGGAAIAPPPRAINKTPRPPRQKRPTDPCERCAMDVRALVTKTMNEIPISQWPMLIEWLRDDINDIESTFAQKREEMIPEFQLRKRRSTEIN